MSTMSRVIVPVSASPAPRPSCSPASTERSVGPVARCRAGVTNTSAYTRSPAPPSMTDSYASRAQSPWSCSTDWTSQKTLRNSSSDPYRYTPRTSAAGGRGPSPSARPRGLPRPPRPPPSAVARGGASRTGLRGGGGARQGGRGVPGEACRRFGLQSGATKDAQEAEAGMVAEPPADERGRKRRFSATQERMAPPNDGFGFGDFAPDYLFLWCERPDPDGGASFLIDGLALLDLLAADDDPVNRELARFCWTVPIDHSEPNFPLASYAPIARRGSGNRGIVRHHPFQAPIPDGDVRRDAEQSFIRRWSSVVTAARDAGPMFHAAAGEMICVDNYRMTHGRDGYRDPARRMLSIWGWSAGALA